MNEQVKTKWVAALRSGQFTQGHGALRAIITDPVRMGMCCLGVLCELYRQEVGGQWKSDEEELGKEVFVPLDGAGSNSYLPQSVAQWAGLATKDYLDSRDPVFPFEERNHGIHVSCAGANDSGCRFPQIADLIERFL